MEKEEQKMYAFVNTALSPMKYSNKFPPLLHSTVWLEKNKKEDVRE